MESSKRRGGAALSPISNEAFVHPFLTQNKNLKILIDEHRTMLTQHSVTREQEQQQINEQHLAQRAVLEAQYQAERFARYQEEVFQAQQLAQQQAEQLAKQQAEHAQQLADHHAQQLARHQEQQLFLAHQQALKYQEQQAEYDLQQQQYYAQQQAAKYQEQLAQELLNEQSIYAQQQSAFHGHEGHGHSRQRGPPREQSPMGHSPMGGHYNQFDLKDDNNIDEFDTFSFQSGMSFLDEQEEEREVVQRPLPQLVRAAVVPPEGPKSAWSKGTPSLIGVTPPPVPYSSGRSRGPPNATVPQEISAEEGKRINFSHTQNNVVSSSSQPTAPATAVAMDPEAAARRLRYLQEKEEADFQRAMALSLEEETRDKERRQAYDKQVDEELHKHVGSSQPSESDDSYSPVNHKKREKNQPYLSASLMSDTSGDAIIRPTKASSKTTNTKPTPSSEEGAVVAKGPFRPVSRKAYCCIHFAGSMGMKNLNGGLMMCHRQRGMMCFNGEHVEAREVTKKKALEIASGAPARSTKFSESITLFINKFPHFLP